MIVSERLGHSSIAITLDTYSHVIRGLKSDAAQLASNAVFGPGLPRTIGRRADLWSVWYAL
jgi:hypothetical protein